jgi:hypothetical protein
MLTRIDDMRSRLSGVENAEDILAAAWDAFDLIRLACRRHEDQSGTEFATYELAAAAAVSGRNIVAGAPSTPLGRTHPAHHDLARVSDAGQVADGLAALAATLSERLTSAALLAAELRDQQAGRQAATRAESIRALFTSG